MTKKKSNKDPNIGNKTFSLNTKDLKSSFIKSNITFIIYYYIITIVFFYFSNTLNVQEFQGKKFHFYPIEYRFKDISHSVFSNFKLLNYEYYKNRTFIGLSFGSYIILFTIYIIGFILILKSLISTQVFQMIIGAIQTNSNVNPNNKPTTVTKIKDSPFVESNKVYSYDIFLALLMLLPMLIHYIIQKMEWTQRDIEKSLPIKFSIYLLLFFGVLKIILNTFFNPKMVNPLKNAEKYLIGKDKEYLTKVNNELNMSYFSFIAPILFILVMFCLITRIYSEIDNNKYLNYLSLITIFIIIPLSLISYTYSIVYKDYKDPNECSSKGYSSNIEIAVKNGVNNLYQAIVKYNYPCFYTS